MSFLSFKYLDSNTFTLVGGRDSKNVYSQYLTNSFGTPFNESPFIIPYDCFLVNVTASSGVSNSWNVHVRSNGVDIIGAVVSVNASTYATQDFAIQLTKGQPIEIYLQTSSPVFQPSVNLIFQRNI